MASFVAAALLGLSVAQSPVEEPPQSSHMDLSVGMFASTPERFVFCAGFSPLRAFEFDVCVGAHRGLAAATSHVYYRAHWFFHVGEGDASLEFAVGPGAGLRVMGVCPFSVCAVGAGPEALASMEVTYWFSPAFGISLQADAGLAVVWAGDSAGGLQHSFRFPARLLVGASF